MIILAGQKPVRDPARSPVFPVFLSETQPCKKTRPLICLDFELRIKRPVSSDRQLTDSHLNELELDIADRIEEYIFAIFQISLFCRNSAPNSARSESEREKSTRAGENAHSSVVRRERVDPQK